MPRESKLENRNSKLENRSSRLENRLANGCNRTYGHSRDASPEGFGPQGESGNPSGQTWTPVPPLSRRTSFAGVTRMEGANALRLAWLLMAVLLAATVGSAQQPITGFPPFSSATPSTFDAVNDADLNVSFSIPAVNKAGRGMPFQYSLVYNSSVWSKWNSTGNLVWTPVSGRGWGNANSGTTGTVAYTETEGSCIYPNGPGGEEYYWNIYDYTAYYGPNGTEHTFNHSVSTWTSSIPCGSGAPPYNYTGTLTDGSGYTIALSAAPSVSVFPTSGLTILVPTNSQQQGTVSDTNSNSIVTTPSSGSTTFTDTLGATVLTVSGSGTPSSPIDYSYTGGSGQVSVQVNYASYTVQTNFGCSGIGEYGPTQAYLVSSITMPDNTSYTFTYEATPGHSSNITGRLASVTLPTGGTISYAYSGTSNGITCQDGSPETLARTVTPGGTWTYVHTEGTSTSTTKITDPNSNDTVITFYGAYAYSNAYEEQRTVYNGSQSSGNVMATVNTCYNGASIPCSGTAVSLPITERAVTTALSTSSGGTVESETNTYYNNYGFVTIVDEYDYGSGAVGAFIRETMRCPYSFSNTYIQDRPQYSLVYSSQGNASNCTGTSGLVAEATYGYDSYGNLTGEAHTNTSGSPSSISSRSRRPGTAAGQLSPQSRTRTAKPPLSLTTTPSGALPKLSTPTAARLPSLTRIQKAASVSKPRAFSAGAVAPALIATRSPSIWTA